jgi:hypothetical protein
MTNIPLGNIRKIQNELNDKRQSCPERIMNRITIQQTASLYCSPVRNGAISFVGANAAILFRAII